MTKTETKKSYKRKKIFLGIGIFASVAFISTGLAAWAVSSKAELGVGGDISVGAIHDATITISELTLSNESFLFEPKESDIFGRVRNDGENFEKLNVTVSGTFTSPENVSATISLSVPESVAKAANEKNYIVLPDCAISPQALKYSPQLDGNGNVINYFSYTIKFGWGSVFNYMNPGEYYDNDPSGSEVPYETVIATLIDLRASMYGSNEKDSKDPLFTVTVRVSSN